MQRSRLLVLGLASFAFIALLPADRAAAQAKTKVPDTTPPIPITKPVSTAGQLDLDVVVSAKNGKPIGGLTQQDFTVYLDKKPQPITSFRALEATAAAAAPIETILLIDSVNTDYIHVGYEREQIDKFLRKNNGKLSQPITLVILSDTGTQITPRPSQDGNELAAFLDKAVVAIRDIGRSTGFYGWTEEFQMSASALERLSGYEQTRPGRKLLIWISPGWPLLSGPEVELTNKDEHNLFNTLVALSASLRKARMTLSSVDPLGNSDSLGYRTLFYESFTKPVITPDKMQIGDLALQVLALQSGGRVLNSSNDVAGEIATAASDADAFYVVRIASAPAEHPNEFRSISVKVDKPGLTARTRTGYYAQP